VIGRNCLGKDVIFTDEQFLQVLQFLLPILIPQTSLLSSMIIFIIVVVVIIFVIVVVIIMQGWYNRPDSGCHTKPIQSQSTQKLKRNVFFDMERFNI
jgi:hypothetical protein